MTMCLSNSQDDDGMKMCHCKSVSRDHMRMIGIDSMSMCQSRAMTMCRSNSHDDDSMITTQTKILEEGTKDEIRIFDRFLSGS